MTSLTTVQSIQGKGRYRSQFPSNQFACQINSTQYKHVIAWLHLLTFHLDTNIISIICAQRFAGETKISRFISKNRKNILSSQVITVVYSIFHNFLRQKFILGCQKDIEILPISIRVGDITAPFSFEKLLHFKSIESISEKSNDPYVCMYVYCARSRHYDVILRTRFNEI